MTYCAPICLLHCECTPGMGEKLIPRSGGISATCDNSFHGSKKERTNGVRRGLKWTKHQGGKTAPLLVSRSWHEPCGFRWVHNENLHGGSLAPLNVTSAPFTTSEESAPQIRGNTIKWSSQHNSSWFTKTNLKPSCKSSWRVFFLPPPSFWSLVLFCCFYCTFVVVFFPIAQHISRCPKCKERNKKM